MATYELIPSHNPRLNDNFLGHRWRHSFSKWLASLRSSRHRRYAIISAMLVFLGIISFYLLKPLKDGQLPKAEPPTLLEFHFGLYQPQYKQIYWLDDGVDGEFVESTDSGFTLANWPNRETRFIANKSLTIQGRMYIVNQVIPNAMRTKTLLQVNPKKRWRYSQTAFYCVLDIDSSFCDPLFHDDFTQSIAVAEWSPAGDTIAFVVDNNIYVREPDGTVYGITTDGSDEIFNGVPDWVYEEEIFGSGKALWWSPSGKYLAFLRTDDSDVKEDLIPKYLNSLQNNVLPYPMANKVKYPKPGFENPHVEMWIYDLQGNNTFTEKLSDIDEKLITEGVWVGDSTFLVKVMSRTSDVSEVILWDVNSQSSSMVRNDSVGSNGPWMEVTHNTLYVPGDPRNGRIEDGYLDLVYVNGFRHLAYFSPPNSVSPRILTTGPWEVVDAPFKVDLQRNQVFFTGTKKSSIEQRLYKVSLDDSNVEPLIAESAEGVFSASYAGDGSYALVNYEGPDIPWQRVVELGSQSVMDADPIQKNDLLHQILQNKTLGTVRYGQIEVSSGININYKEYLPYEFDENKKHPLLFYVYGGPGSQQVTKKYGIDFQRVFAETHNAIVVTIDPRGTGAMGQQFQSSVRDNLGVTQAQDLIAAARDWNRKKYVDETTTAIWGWSYGGYLSLKTLEQDIDQVFKFGVAVAPVTDWRLYDSIYTERYMHKPEDNKDGYERSAIANITTLKRHDRVLIMHGTADDNVQFQNTMVLLDKMNLGGMTNYDVHIFPDSDHNIYFHNANAVLYDRLDSWLKKQQDHN